MGLIGNVINVLKLLILKWCEWFFDGVISLGDVFRGG